MASCFVVHFVFKSADADRKRNEENNEKINNQKTYIYAFVQG